MPDVSDWHQQVGWHLSVSFMPWAVWPLVPRIASPPSRGCPLSRRPWILKGSEEQWLSSWVERALGTAWGGWIFIPALWASCSRDSYFPSLGLRLHLSDGGLWLIALNVSVSICYVAFRSNLPCVSVSVSLSFPSVLPLKCVINQEFTVKAQEELNDVFSSGKYLVPQGARGCFRSPMPPKLWLLRAFSVDPPTQL